MRVVSFNICRCKYASIQSIVEYVLSLNADILFLQEVDRNVERSFGIDQFAEIRDKCGYTCSSFCETLQIGKEGKYGTALFTKNDVGIISYTDLTIQEDKEPRCSINLNFYDLDLDMYFVHLSKNQDCAVTQLNRLLSLSNHNEHSIIVGDFNIDSQTLEKEFGFFEDDLSFTWPIQSPSKRIDHFMYRKKYLMNFATLSNGSYSDHFAISACLSQP